MDKSLILIKRRDDATSRKQLRVAIARKRKLFLKLEEKVNSLRDDLQHIEEEYRSRVGKLYQEDTLLDVAIIRRRKINQLVDEGKNAIEAEEEVRQSMEQETERVEKERIETFIHFFDEDTKEIESTGSIRDLWKKLVRQFHPDLTNNQDEKLEREKIIKTINTAYKENDFQTLRIIDEKGIIKKSDKLEDATTQELEIILIEIENALIRLHETQKEMTTSEWYGFWKLSKKAREQLFEEMEQRLQKDIAQKQEILTNLMNKASLS